MTTKRWRTFDNYNQVASDEVPTMGQNTGSSTGRAGVVYESTSSAGGSPARTSPSRGSDGGSPGSGAGSSSSSCESLTLFSDPEGGSSLRMYPDYLAPMEELTSGSFSRRWPSSGFTTSPTEFWTADTSECPSGGGAYSSLRDVLEANAPSRFYLSRRAAAGIMRRADGRDRTLPPELDRALRSIANEEPRAEPEDAEDATTTEDALPGQQTLGDREVGTLTTATGTKMSHQEMVSGQVVTDAEARGDVGALTTGTGTKGGLPEVDSGQIVPTESTVRRLTPTECERLQGFPDGWTVIW